MKSMPSSRSVPSGYLIKQPTAGLSVKLLGSCAGGELGVVLLVMSDDFGVQSLRLLGLKLCGFRQKSRQSLSDVADSVEISEQLLESFEQGHERPSEDVLMLLINHFNMNDDTAVDLLELAGYETPEAPQQGISPEAMLTKQPVLMLMAMDSRIVYTDGVHIAASPEGVVLNFTQSGSQTAAGQPLTVARVGMSPAQANNVLQTLSKTLAMLQRPSIPNNLPAPKNHQPKKFDQN